MSFGINGPDNKPVIREAQGMFNNGGGGNLGYFQQGRKKKNNEKEEQDIFELSSSKKDTENTEDLDFNLDEIGTKIKNFWMKFHTNSEQSEPNQNEENPEK